MKKEIKKILFIILGVLFTLFIIFMIFWGRGMIKQYLLNKEREEAKQKTSEYLYNKYQKNLNLELISEGKKAREITIDASTSRCGHEKNINQYVFKVFSNDNPVTSYITLWKNVKTDEVKIEEVNGDKSNRNITSYEIQSRLYTEKKMIKESFDKKIGNNKNYYINYNYRDDKIKIRVMKDLDDVLDTDMDYLKHIINVLKGKIVEIVIESNDLNRIEFKASTEPEKQIEFLNLVKIVSKHLKKNVKPNYLVQMFDSSIEVNINENIVDKYNSKEKDKYIKFLDDLYDLLEDNERATIYLKFLDHKIQMNKNQWKGLENNMKYWK